MKTILIALTLSLSFSTAFAQSANSLLQLAADKSPTTNSLKAPSSKPAKKISNGGCCGAVNGHCIAICGKPGGCTGNGDCKTNPN